jgi:alpha-L-rhamnosidase
VKQIINWKKTTFILCFICFAFSLSGMEEDIHSEFLQNSIIWADTVPMDKQAYVAFRKTFQLESDPQNVVLRIFADNRYILWINERYVERGPCRFDPKRPEYDLLHVTSHIHKGNNILAVLVHNYGKTASSSARIMEHDPGLAVKLDVSFSCEEFFVLSTDSTWKVNTETRYLPSPPSYTSIPDNIDARKDDGNWWLMDYDDSAWEKAVLINKRKWGRLHPRSIPLLQEDEIIPKVIVDEKTTNYRNSRPQKLADCLPMLMEQGHQLVLDIGKEVQAYCVLDFEAEDGSELEVDFSARYLDSRRRPEMSGRKHRNLYIACSGRQQYMSTDTFGGKYLIITVKSGMIRLYHVKVVDRRYPFSRLGRFHCNDDTLNEIWNICVNTVELCSEDAYVDCADRERAQWIADGYRMGYRVSRIALAGPGEEGYFYCDYRLLRNMLRHMSLSQLPDGRLQPMRPSDYPVDKTHGVIDDYSCLWIQAVREMYDRSGDKDFVLEVWPVVVKTMDNFLSRRTRRGLVNAMEFVYFSNPLAYQVCEGATINAFIYRSLKDAAYLGHLVQDTEIAFHYEKAAEMLYQNYNIHLWDLEVGSYKGSLSEKSSTRATGHAAVLALFYDVVPPDRREMVLKFLLEHFEETDPFPYTFAFYLDVLFSQDSKVMDQLALDTVRRRWGPMTKYETQTTSESWANWSYVHESGASPAYFLSAYILGVRTEGKHQNSPIIIQPRLADLELAKGQVLTEYGPVSVLWELKQKDQLDFSFEIPRGTEAIVSIPVYSKNPTMEVDGVVFVKRNELIVPGVIKKRRYIQFKAKNGFHKGLLR